MFNKDVSCINGGVRGTWEKIEIDLNKMDLQNNSEGSLELTLNEYQARALDTAYYPGRNLDLMGLMYATLKLNGEAGEFAEHVGKAIRDDKGMITPDRKNKLIKELGDVMWYLAALSSELETSLQEVALLNLVKLADRKNRGVLGGSGDER